MVAVATNEGAEEEGGAVTSPQLVKKLKTLLGPKPASAGPATKPAPAGPAPKPASAGPATRGWNLGLKPAVIFVQISERFALVLR